MKKNKRIIAMSLAAILTAVSLGGCGNSESQVQGTVKEQEKRNVKQELTFTKYDFIKKGASDYVILTSDAPTKNETFAAEELRLFVKEASGAELPIQKESDSTAEQFISIGATEKAKAAGVIPAYDKLLNNGYVITTVDDDCYLQGYSDIGTRNSVYEFLSQCFDFECYAADEICMVETKDLKLPLFEISEKPSFDWREANNGDIIRNETATCRMRFNINEEIYITGHQTHNSMELIDPYVYDFTSEEYKNWFSTAGGTNPILNVDSTIPAQLCYSNTDMEKEYVKNLLIDLEDAKAPVYLLGMEDNVQWCTCDKCATSKEKYGTNAAVMIKFANRVQDAVNEWCANTRPDEEPIKLIFFAYYETVVPPVTYNEATKTYEPTDESVVLHPDLGIMYAPIGATYAYSFVDERNAETKKQIEGWGALTDNIYAWTYSLHTFHGFILHDTFEVMQDNYQFLLENGTTAILDQTDHYQKTGNSGWSRAKAYVMSKLQWNANLNMEELLDDFFANYFDKAGDTMQALFNEEREWLIHVYKDLGASGKISDDLNAPEYWSYPMLVDALEQIEQAYEDIAEYKESNPERYELLYDRIMLESIQYRYLLICNYSTKYDEAELLNMKNSFKTDFERLNITSYSENNDIAVLWANWGIK